MILKWQRNATCSSRVEEHCIKIKKGNMIFCTFKMLGLPTFFSFRRIQKVFGQLENFYMINRKKRAKCLAKVQKRVKFKRVFLSNLKRFFF